MSSFFRKRVRGLLRTTFSSPNVECDGIIEEESFIHVAHGKDISDNSIIYDRILNGKNGRKVEIPEIYAGKTGLDLPAIQLDELSTTIRSCYTGPDGGLTKVQEMRQQPIVRMANLDDELSLSSIDDIEERMGEEENWHNEETVANGCRKLKPLAKPVANSNSLEALGFTVEDLLPSSSSTKGYNWNSADDQRAYGISTSLYEKHPITHQCAGTPIADVFAIISRENNAILALADGVNWGEGSRLAARCAIRGAMDHLNTAILKSHFETTTDVFHCLLGAFHAGHALILQEGGSLTTLCVAFIAPVKNSNSFVMCVCNVGDSLCFVYNPAYGVREITLASHNIEQMRDMRDAGGALGPVDGRNPQLHNLTCSMTFVEEGDLVFLTSDGVSDNFDPVVGKFCVIKKSDSEKENCVEEDPRKTNSQSLNKNSRAQANQIPVRPKRCNATLPCVDAVERHELMLIRMADIIFNGVNTTSCTSPYFKDLENEHKKKYQTPPLDTFPTNNPITASKLCENLVQFAYQLSDSKRQILQDPDLYRSRTHSKTEERLRRKMIRNMIMEMPGKLDHASVVAYKVGLWEDKPNEDEPITPLANGYTLDGPTNGHAENHEEVSSDEKLNEENTRENTKNNIVTKMAEVSCNLKLEKPYAHESTSTTIMQEDKLSTDRRLLRLDIPPELQNGTISTMSPSHTQRSPYEEQPISFEAAISPFVVVPRPAKKHRRGSVARHTLGVDVAWLKRLVTSKSENSGTNTPTKNAPTSPAKTSRAQLVSDLNHATDSIPNHQPDRNNFSLKKLKAFIVRPIRTSSNDSFQVHQPPALHHTVSTPVRSAGHA